LIHNIFNFFFIAQLALYKSPQTAASTPLLANPIIFQQPGNQQPQLIIDPQAQLQAQQQQASQPAQAQFSASGDKILTKLELINDKLDQLKTITSTNNQSMPNMETAVLLQNIQRIVKENEQYKKEIFEKSNKIEEQNLRITELLTKAQNYVEQSHLILEQKNVSFISNTEKNVQRVLELEQDKMRLTGDLSKLTAQISELNMEISRMQKAEMEMRQNLIEVSKNTDTHKQNAERLTVENADLQTKLDTIVSEMKKERQLRKSLETKLSLNEDEMNEMRNTLTNSQKALDERKRKSEQEKHAFENELDELKRQHSTEMNVLKERLQKFRSNAAEAQSEQLKQIEADMNREWQAKLDKAVVQLEQKYERQLSQLRDEKNEVEKQSIDSRESVKTQRAHYLQMETERDTLRQKLDELSVFKEKYERLQAQAISMKERYETRIRELLDTEPDAELIADEVKKIMNAMYKKLKAQVKPDEHYNGAGILTAMIKLIKLFTLKLLETEQGETKEEEEIDYFSEYIYKPPPPPPHPIEVSKPVTIFVPAQRINTETLSEHNVAKNVDVESQLEQTRKEQTNSVNEANSKEEEAADKTQVESTRIISTLARLSSTSNSLVDMARSESSKEASPETENSNNDKDIRAKSDLHRGDSNEEDDDDIQLVKEEEQSSENFINELTKSLSIGEASKLHEASNDDVNVDNIHIPDQNDQPQSKDTLPESSRDELAQSFEENKQQKNEDAESNSEVNKLEEESKVSHESDQIKEELSEKDTQHDNFEMPEDKNKAQPNDLIVETQEASIEVLSMNNENVANEEEKADTKIIPTNNKTNLSTNRGLFDDDDDEDDSNNKLFSFGNTSSKKE
jgi:hypothetical protein